MASTVDAKRVKEYNEVEKDPHKFALKLDKLTQMIRDSNYTVFYTGAGVSTSSGVGDYRGPSGAWTKRRIKELERGLEMNALDDEDKEELRKLKAEREKEIQKSAKKVAMLDAQPSYSHMAQAALIRHGYAHYVITTNLDGIYRKAGLGDKLCCLHGDVYIERCTGCGYDFERNYEVRQGRRIHVHDHKVGIGRDSNKCSRCGSVAPSSYTGNPDGKMKKSKWPNDCMIGTNAKNVGTKDTHINFGEHLDPRDWDEAEEHCGKADLCIVAGTSMSLRHITHMPFMAKRTVIINLQATPDDEEANLRIWAPVDVVFEGVLDRLGLENDPVPVWKPRDAVPLDALPRWLSQYYREKAVNLESMISQREREACERAGVSDAAAPSSTADSAAPISTRAPCDECGVVGDCPCTLRHEAEDLLEAGICIGNTHSETGEKSHEWSMFLRPIGPGHAEVMGRVIEKVEYSLHPTFSPPRVLATEPPYTVTRRGWGTFRVGVTIHWSPFLEDWEPLEYSHELKFDAAETQNVVQRSRRD